MRSHPFDFVAHAGPIEAAVLDYNGSNFDVPEMLPLLEKWATGGNARLAQVANQTPMFSYSQEDGQRQFVDGPEHDRFRGMRKTPAWVQAKQAHEDPAGFAVRAKSDLSKWTKNPKKFGLSLGKHMYAAMAVAPSLSSDLQKSLWAQVTEKENLYAAIVLYRHGNSECIQWLGEPGRLLGRANGSQYLALGARGRMELEKALLDQDSHSTRVSLVDAAQEFKIWDDEMLRTLFSSSERGWPDQSILEAASGELPPLGPEWTTPLEAMCVQAEANPRLSSWALRLRQMQHHVSISKEGLPTEPIEEIGNYAPYVGVLGRMSADELTKTLLDLNSIASWQVQAWRRCEHLSVAVDVARRSENPFTQLALCSFALEPTINGDQFSLSTDIGWALGVEALTKEYRPEFAHQEIPDIPTQVRLSSPHGFRKALRDLRDPDVQEQVRDATNKGTKKSRTLAQGLLEILEHRDPEIVALHAEATESALPFAEIADTFEIDRRRSATGTSSQGPLLSRIFKKHGMDAYLACVLRIAPSRQHHDRNLPTGEPLREFARGLVGIVVNGPEVSNIAVRTLADESRFRGRLYKLSIAQQAELDSPELVPLLLECLDTKRSEREVVINALQCHPKRVVPLLGEYITRPSHQVGAIELAEQLAASDLTPSLLLALERKPSKAIRIAIENALLVCRVTDSLNWKVELLRLGKTNSKLFTPARSLFWKDDSALTAEETRGLVSAMTFLKDVPSSGTAVNAMSELRAPDVQVLVAEILSQLSGKKAEVWRIYALGAFADEESLRDFCDNIVDNTSQSSDLARHVIAMLEQRSLRDGPGRAFRALVKLSRSSPARRNLSERAIARLLSTSQKNAFTWQDLALAGADDMVTRQELRAHMESSMILGRPFDPISLAALLATPSVSETLDGLLFEQGSRFYLLRDGALLDEGGETLQTGTVLLAHPVVLNEKQLRQARAFLGEQTPPFLQLERRVASVTGKEIEALRNSAKAIPDLCWRLSTQGFVDGEYLPDSNTVMSMVYPLGFDSHIEFFHDGMRRDRIEDMGVKTPFNAQHPALLSELYIHLKILFGLL